MSRQDKKITEDMSIAEVLKMNPASAKVLLRHGMHCIGCAAANGESIGEAAVVHGIDLEVLVNDLNAV